MNRPHKHRSDITGITRDWFSMCREIRFANKLALPSMPCVEFYAEYGRSRTKINNFFKPKRIFEYLPPPHPFHSLWGNIQQWQNSMSLHVMSLVGRDGERGEIKSKEKRGGEERTKTRVGRGGGGEEYLDMMAGECLT